MATDNTPVIVGVAQHTAHPDEVVRAEEPLSLMLRVAKAALLDAGVSALAQHLDSVRVVNVLSWTYDRAAQLLAERLDLPAGERLYSTIGGNTPLWLINETAEALSRREIKAALLVGAEAGHTVKVANQRGDLLPWTQRHSSERRDRVVGDRRLGWSPLEARYEATLPAWVFPLFENALRAASGLDLNQHRRWLAALCARFSRVARDNHYAWFRDGKGEEEIGTVTAENRMIAFPYPKFMNAIIAVDQAAGVIMTTAGLARTLGVPRQRWVYPIGCGDAHDIFNISERRDFISSPALRAAAEQALTQARLEIDEIELLDLYSCFPASPQMAAREIGVELETDRPPTVTGGLAYFGGPGNNYSMHAVATMVDKLRSGKGRSGLIYALGWYFAKHSIGIYSRDPLDSEWRRQPPANYQRELDRQQRTVIAEEAAGSASIETYTVLHDREGGPRLAIVVGRLEDGRRFVANTEFDRDLLISFENEEMVGVRGKVRHDAGVGRNIFCPAGL